MLDQTNPKDTNTDVLSDVECDFAGYYIVAFVDLLGTESKNAEIKAQPEFPAELLKREVYKVNLFQRDFYDFFENSARSEKKFKSLRPKKLKADLEKLQGNDVKSYAFSDSLIFYASLNTQQGRLVPLSSCFNLLTALVCTQLLSLARGIPFRGGVEVGRAAQFNGNQILGPALSDAVKLEKQAQFPRILVGNEFHKYLHLYSQLPLSTPESRANRAFAEICISQICESDEPFQLHIPNKTNENQTRVFSLDVHSDLVSDLIGDEHQKLVNKARSFAESEIQRFNGHDEKLACRYRHLLTYLRGERVETVRKL